MAGIPENYESFIRPSCAQQTSQYPYYTYPNNTSYYSNYDFMCTPRTNQSFYSDSLDTSTNNWMADIEKRLRYTDKIETIEITSKDLSPASCFSNIESTFSTTYNTQYYYNYPSCSQVNNNLIDYNNFAQQFYSQQLVDINQRAECSIDSDIIVEDSEECFTNDSQELGRFVSNCIVCDVPYTPQGTQFYTLTNSMPLTMSTQRPVYLKLIEILGSNLDNTSCHLCSNCLNLVNTIEHLQLKLETTKKELLDKFRTTCQNKQYLIQKKRKRFRNFCGLHFFKCKLCKKRLTPRKLFKTHLAKHKMQQRYLCELCGHRFTSRDNLKLHALKHQQPTVCAFVCQLCEKPFRTKSNLKEHFNYCSDNYPYECCDKKFAVASKLKYHRKLKHDKKFIAICSICNVGFVKISEYKTHKISHSTEKKHSCTQCNKSYKTISNLNFHMKMHNRTLPFICTICNKGFMRKEYLEAHVNNHNGIKNFVCSFCDKKFVSQKNLDAHVKYHEGSIKKRNCNICNKIITTGFDDHLRTHSNLKEFQCDLCLMKFNTKSALGKHKNRKHS